MTQELNYAQANMNIVSNACIYIKFQEIDFTSLNKYNLNCAINCSTTIRRRRKMPKNWVINTKSAQAKARTDAVRKEVAEKKQKETEDKFWEDNDKHVSQICQSNTILKQLIEINILNRY